jgi:hypothetical protein
LSIPVSDRIPLYGALAILVGSRRVIRFNWVTSQGDRRIAMLRHRVSAPIKRLFGALRATDPAT